MSKSPSEHLVTLAITDYAGLTRGRSMPARDFTLKGPSKTMGWVPANMSLTTYDVIADPNPWGSVGDLRLMPDRGARFTCTPPGAATPLDVVMSDIIELDGAPWECCPRAFLKAALADFKNETDCEFIASFEQEFQVLGAAWPDAPSFGLSTLRRTDPFGPDVVATLRQAGIPIETFVAEYGRDQFELTTPPTAGLAAADRAVIIREVVKEVARLKGWQATFAPKTSRDGVGNGVHIHFSFSSAKGAPVAYDAGKPGRLSPMAASFCAGVLQHLPALVALTAASPISGLRLQPHNWSSSYTWIADKDREATLRICPTVTLGGKDPAKQFNIEYRACDATASPHLALAALVRAGLEGIKAHLPAPSLFNGDPTLLTEAMRQKLHLFRLPTTLPEALECLEQDQTVCSWLSKRALETYIGMKRKELELSAAHEGDALCQRYAKVY
jgi:glutamine synthetase